MREKGAVPPGIYSFRHHRFRSVQNAADAKLVKNLAKRRRFSRGACRNICLVGLCFRYFCLRCIDNSILEKERVLVLAAVIIFLLLHALLKDNAKKRKKHRVHKKVIIALQTYICGKANEAAQAGAQSCKSPLKNAGT